LIWSDRRLCSIYLNENLFDERRYQVFGFSVHK
jgi:hypothetical protein